MPVHRCRVALSPLYAALSRRRVSVLVRCVVAVRTFSWPSAAVSRLLFYYLKRGLYSACQCMTEGDG